jgi:hypothetical protein
MHWKRSEFESATDPRPLVEALSRELTNRLRSSSDPETESRNIVEELRSDGHELFSWDESTDFQTWGDSWVPPKGKNRIIIDFNYPEDEPPSVEVHFGPWPK